jgi:predicted O-methyltransferase YrrM
VNAHGIHSPFMFNLYQSISERKRFSSEVATIWSLRKQLLSDETEISFRDPGDNNKIKKRSISSLTKRVTKSNNEGLLLYSIIKHLKPKNGIELGTSLGISALYQNLACPNLNLVSIEGAAEIYELAKTNVKIAGGGITLKLGKFDETLPSLLKDSNYSYAFIDGFHQFEPTLRYFNMIKDHIEEGGFIIFDDIHWSKDMKLVWLEIIKHPSVTLSMDLFYLGVVFFKQGVEKQHFTLRC